MPNSICNLLKLAGEVVKDSLADPCSDPELAREVKNVLRSVA